MMQKENVQRSNSNEKEKTDQAVCVLGVRKQSTSCNKTGRDEMTAGEGTNGDKKEYIEGNPYFNFQGT